MVFHAFKGDEETDAILREIPKMQKSKFMKEAIKTYVSPETRETVEKPVIEAPKTFRVKL